MTAAPCGGPLPDPRAHPDKDAALVQAMFDRVAPRYDLVNTVLSAGQDAHWRRVAARAAAVGPGRVALDVATGTGKVAQELARAGAHVCALDFSVAMLATGQRRDGVPASVRWCAGDGTRLPLEDASVDAVTIGFGLRNLADLDAALVEFARVARPGARLVILEFSQPPRAALRRGYHALLRAAVPRVARAVASDPRAYTYLAESIAAWPDATELADRVAAAGWARVGVKRLAAGAVAVHRAVRPAKSPSRMQS
jgi:demethylmenaquinone methyltransferase/2-methoxy-6-polyprenyl-1,4-benzoquinol methylase